MEEHLLKVLHDLDFAREELQEANHAATATEHLLIMQLIEGIAKTRNDTNALLNAHIIDREKEK